MKKRKTYGTMVYLFCLLLVFSLVASVSLKALTSEEAKLGNSLGEVLLQWKLMVFNGPSYARESGLGSALTSLHEELEDFDSPDSLIERIPPLKAKLERAKSQDLWTYQFGFWNFAQDDPTVSLSGAEKDEDILVNGSQEDGSSSGRMGFKYLKFAGDGDRAVINVGEPLTTPLSKSFTVEFWIRIREDSAEQIAKTDNWKLGLEENLPRLELGSGDQILKGKFIPLSYWTHLALIWNEGEVRLYQNGNEVGKANVSDELNVSERFVLGGDLAGDLDELRIKDRSVDPEYLNFDQPLDYLVGFPVLSWAQSSFGSEELWHFYAGLLVSNIKMKQESDSYSVSGDNANQVAKFLLSEKEASLKLPEALPGEVVENIKKMHQLGDNGKLSDGDREELNLIVESLTSYLGLD